MRVLTTLPFRPRSNILLPVVQQYAVRMTRRAQMMLPSTYALLLQAVRSRWILAETKRPVVKQDQLWLRHWLFQKPEL